MLMLKPINEISVVAEVTDYNRLSGVRIDHTVPFGAFCFVAPCTPKGWLWRLVSRSILKRAVGVVTVIAKVNDPAVVGINDRMPLLSACLDALLIRATLEHREPPSQVGYRQLLRLN